MIQIEMEMADKCSECRFRTDYEFCSAMPKNFCGNTSDEGKPDWCPLKNADGWISVKDRLPENAKHPEPPEEDNDVVEWKYRYFQYSCTNCKEIFNDDIVNMPRHGREAIKFCPNCGKMVKLDG